MSLLSIAPTPAAPPTWTEGATLPGLAVSTAGDDADFVINLDGELDIGTVAKLDAAIRRALGSQAAEIVVDLSTCTFIDSTGIRALLRLNRRLAVDLDRDLLILPGPAHVQRTFGVCGLLDVLPFPET